MPVSGNTITSSSDVYEAQVEKVRNNVQELFETSNTVAALVEKGGEYEKVSERLYRIPLVTAFGGVFGKFDANAGDMGNGSGPIVKKMTAGFVYSRYTFELSQQSMDVTSSSEQSKLNTFNFVFKGAMKQLQAYDDIFFHTDGTGKLTGAASAGGAATLTFASTTDARGVQLLREGMQVQVYDSSAAGYMTGTYTIGAINYGTKQVTFTTNLSATGASGDYLVVVGVSDNPATSFQSGYPVTSLTADSFRHGLPYFNDYTASNYVLGLLKSATPQLLPASVDAASSGVVFQHGQLLRDQLIQRRDPEAYMGMVGISSQAQRAAISNIGNTISNWQRTPGQDSIDLNPKNSGQRDTFDFAGFKMYVSKRQPTDRIDFFNPKLFGRAYAADTHFHSVGGKTIFQSRTSSGSLKAAQHFHIVQSYDWYSTDPGAAGVIYGAAIPTGY